MAHTKRWKPNLKAVEASIRFLYQTGRLSRWMDMEQIMMFANLSEHEAKPVLVVT